MSYDLWTAATTDADAEHYEQVKDAAFMATRSHLGFLLEAHSDDEYSDRMTMVGEHIAGAIERLTNRDATLFPILHTEVLNVFQANFEQVQAAREAERQATQRRLRAQAVREAGKAKGIAPLFKQAGTQMVSTCATCGQRIGFGDDGSWFHIEGTPSPNHDPIPSTGPGAKTAMPARYIETTSEVYAGDNWVIAGLVNGGYRWDVWKSANWKPEDPSDFGKQNVGSLTQAKSEVNDALHYLGVAGDANHPDIARAAFKTAVFKWTQEPQTLFDGSTRLNWVANDGDMRLRVQPFQTDTSTVRAADAPIVGYQWYVVDGAAGNRVIRSSNGGDSSTVEEAQRKAEQASASGYYGSKTVAVADDLVDWGAQERKIERDRDRVDANGNPVHHADDDLVVWDAPKRPSYAAWSKADDRDLWTAKEAHGVDLEVGLIGNLYHWGSYTPADTAIAEGIHATLEGAQHCASSSVMVAEGLKTAVGQFQPGDGIVVTTDNPEGAGWSFVGEFVGQDPEEGIYDIRGSQDGGQTVEVQGFPYTSGYGWIFTKASRRKTAGTPPWLKGKGDDKGGDDKAAKPTPDKTPSDPDAATADAPKDTDAPPSDNDPTAQKDDPNAQAAPKTPDQQDNSDPTTMDIGATSHMGFTMADGGTGQLEVTFIREQDGVYFFNGPTGEFGVGQQNGVWQDKDGNTFTFGAAPATDPQSQAVDHADDTTDDPEQSKAPEDGSDANANPFAKKDKPPANPADDKDDDRKQKVK